MQITLLSFDIKRIKEIAALEGLNPESLSENQVWCIVSQALVTFKRELKLAQCQ